MSTESMAFSLAWMPVNATPFWNLCSANQAARARRSVSVRRIVAAGLSR